LAKKLTRYSPRAESARVASVLHAAPNALRSSAPFCTLVPRGSVISYSSCVFAGVAYFPSCCVRAITFHCTPSSGR